MKRLARSLLHLLVLLCLATSAAARPRPPAPPWPELSLARWTFDEPLATGTNLSPAQLTALHRAESWSGYALTRAGVSAPPVWLPALSDSGRVQVAPEAGAVRFWFRPDWSSGEDLSAAGFPRLIELIRLAPAGPETAWSLHFDSDGGRLLLTRVAGGAAVDILSAPIAWTAGEWRLVALEWSATATGLYLDGELAALGGGLPLSTGFAAASAGLVVGSDAVGGNLAQGQFEEVTSFRRIEAGRLPYYQAGYAWLAALGPITPEEDAARALQRQLLLAARASVALEGGGVAQMSFGPGDPCPTNGPVYMTNLWCGFATNTGWTMQFDVAGGTNNVLYDVFTTAGLFGSNVAEAQCYQVAETYNCATVVLTNQFTYGAFYILGLTNDTDAGGLSDAFEALVTGGDNEDADDDLLTPLVRIEVTDSVAVEQQLTNTARFRLTRQGGFLKQPLTVALLVSGTATIGSDYTLSRALTTASNLLVTFAPRETIVELVLTAVDDAVPEGTETATLTLTTNTALWTLDPRCHTATAWILEEYTKTYTTTNDFKLGVMAGLETVEPAPNGQLQFQTNLPPQFPFINVACSVRGTVARINTTNGQVVGEYRTAPARTNAPAGYNDTPDPSRTTVDQYGNVWVANRQDHLRIGPATNGSITRIGLIVGGTRHRKNADGTFTPDAQGSYLSISNATYNTCIERDGDGFIRTSRGLADILPWANPGGEDSAGGVYTAEDEAIAEFIRVPCVGTRTLAVDKFNDVWVGGIGASRAHAKVDGLSASLVPGSVFAPGAGGYGGVVDGQGVLWSSPGRDAAGVLRLVPPVQGPVTTNDWRPLWTGGWNVDGEMYGLAVDPRHRYVWQTAFNYGQVFRWHPDGSVVTNASGGVETFPVGSANAQGLTVDERGHVWIAHGNQGGATTVGHLDTNGVLVGTVTLTVGGATGTGPTGLSVDQAGKVWVANYGSHNVMRIDPAAGTEVIINEVTQRVGAVDLVVDLGTGSSHQPPHNVEAYPYNYSDMTGFNSRIVNPGLQPLKGYWTVIHDCERAGEFWQRVSWNAVLTNGGEIEVVVRASDDRAALAREEFLPVGNNVPFTGFNGRFIEMRVALTRTNASQQPVLYDLTLHGLSTGFADAAMDILWEPFEAEDGEFCSFVAGPEPVTYQWFILYPWTNQWALLPGVTGPELVLTNVDLWDDWTQVSLSVSNAAGEKLWLGPVTMRVWAGAINIPTYGAASRYPATIDVQGEPTNLWFVDVGLTNLNHDYPADLDILLVSPTGFKIMLMSDAGTNIPVSGATLVFHPATNGYAPPPYQATIQSGLLSDFSPSNFDGENDSMPPPAPSYPYSTNLSDLEGSNPNGVWKLFINDDRHGQGGVLHDSWGLRFYYR